MRIQEVADLLGTTARAIRLYEQKGLLQPGKDEDNGYRHYETAHIEQLQWILALRELGLSLETIAGLLSVRGQPEVWAEQLEAARASLYRQHLAAAQGLQALDGVMSALERTREVPLQEMLSAASHLRESRLLRESWQDRWDYDRLAQRMDDGEVGLPLAFSADGLSDDLYARTLDAVTAAISPQPGERGLDLGTGLGNLAWRLAATGAEVIGVEQSTEMLRACRRRHPQLPVRQGNLLALPFADATADFITCSFALHHLTPEQQRLALREIGRVLKRNGRVCIAGLNSSPIQANNKAPLWHPLIKTSLINWFQESGMNYDITLLSSAVMLIHARAGSKI
ncbi:MerR family transcriptional regulator [Paenibacillus daejeonensis]|uniref:MerR family transcriptional regulator n=1 Tax=Paenibacillus daejeonensis TaxID=135193 RepID=UPI000382922B|nr:MerR family transcriptional regulator [Paenibacillus daejeonensis]